MKITNLALALLASATLAACSANDTRPAAPAMASNGVLTGPNGMTLYTFDKGHRRQRQERLQRTLRHELAAALRHGWRYRQRRLQHRHP
jgi:hypothetical protein